MAEGDYKRLDGPEVHDGDVVTPPVEQQSREAKRTQERLEKTAGKTTKVPSDDKRFGGGPGTQENKHTS